MFIYKNETELVNYIIENKNKIHELKDDIIIGTEHPYGIYMDKDYNKHYKYSDIITSNLNTIKFIEVRCEYISPELFYKSRESVRRMSFLKNIEVIFIGTKISDKIRREIESSKNMKYIILKNVKYIKNKDEKKTKKIKLKPDIEVFAYYCINFVLQIDMYGYFYKGYKYFISDERDKLRVSIIFNNGYGFNIVIFLRTEENGYYVKGNYIFAQEYEITESNNENILLKRYWDGWYISKVKSLYTFLSQIPKGYLDDKNINEIVDIIYYANDYRYRFKD